jgi:hypothetical protein
MIKRHVVENISQEESVNGAIDKLTFVFWLSGRTKREKVVIWVKGKVKLGENVRVLNISAAVSRAVDVYAVLAQVPGLTHVVYYILAYSTMGLGIAKVTPAAIIEEIGKSEEVHHVTLQCGSLCHGRVPE